MTLRKFATARPVVALLALSGPVAGASAQTGSGSGSGPGSGSGSPGSSIPCYPFPAWCTPNGQALTPWPFKFQFPTALLVALGSYTAPGTVTTAP
jgi:hypothetical protein